jgi:hypothetical protein
MSRSISFQVPGSGAALFAKPEQNDRNALRPASGGSRERPGPGFLVGPGLVPLRKPHSLAFRLRLAGDSPSETSSGPFAPGRFILSGSYEDKRGVFISITYPGREKRVNSGEKRVNADSSEHKAASKQRQRGILRNSAGCVMPQP